jgi:four helix bundle protein
MATIRSFEDIEAWQKARKLSKDIFELTMTGTFAKDFSLRDQINRATGSIMDNIAEGFERGGTREFIQFLAIAKGSAGEVRSQLYRALDRKHLENSQYIILLDNITKVSKMINGFITYLRDLNHKGMKFNA